MCWRLICLNLDFLLLLANVLETDGPIFPCADKLLMRVQRDTEDFSDFNVELHSSKIFVCLLVWAGAKQSKSPGTGQT